MIRTFLAIAGILAFGSQLTQAQDTVAVDLVVNNQIRKVVVQLAPDAAPQTCENFKKLARSGFYNGMAVHRAIPSYIVQMGDPLTKDNAQKEAWGTGGPDYTLPAEIKLPHIRGAIAMARLPNSRNPNRASNGSQFYFALDDLDHLNGQYTVFGRVVSGIEHLDYIAEQTVDTNDVPMNRIEISSVSMVGETSPTSVLAPVAAAVGNVGDGSGAVREAPGKVLNAAGEGMRGAGEAVAGVIPDRISMPKMPSFGRKSEGDLEDAVGSDEVVTEIPVEEVAVDESFDEKKRRLPNISMPNFSNSIPKLPSFGRSKDEPVSQDEASAAPPTEAPAIRAAIISDVPAETGSVEEDPETGKKKLSLRPKKQEEKEAGVMGRAIKRIW